MSRISAELSTAGADVRWVRADNLHLTLKFLGNVDETIIHEVSAAVEATAGEFGTFDMALSGLGMFPPGGAPRVIWCGLEEPTGTLERLYYALNATLAPYAERDEHRRFSPHITLGRVRSPRRREDLGRLVEENRNVEIGPQSVEAVTVMMSELTPRGPIYTPLSTAPLGGG